MSHKVRAPHNNADVARLLGALESSTRHLVGAIHTQMTMSDAELKAQAERDWIEDERQIKIEQAQFKARIPTDDRSYEGIAAVYGVVVDALGIRFQPGCFKRARISDVQYWWEHNEGPSGRVGTTAEVTALYEVTRKELPTLLQLSHPEATGGLVVVRRYKDRDNGQAALDWIRSGRVMGLSVAYKNCRTTTRTEDGRRVTDIYDADLVEISDTRRGGACPGVMPVTGTKQYSILQGRYHR